MPTPIETVATFLSLWESPGGLARAIHDYFTADAVWENVGLTKTAGPDEAMTAFASFGLPPDEIIMRVDTLAIAAVGDKVLTERIDHIVEAGGVSLAAFAVMGIFEVADGKIAAWRDYFDTAGLTTQQQA